MSCPLCGSKQNSFCDREGHYRLCALCDLRFLEPARRLKPDDERARYLEHNNDVADPRYRAFMSPLVEAIRARVTDGAGLDFGAGFAPVLTHMFSELGYSMRAYDPFFLPEAAALASTYDFIVCSEAAEHFFSPDAEFARFKNLLRPGAWLGLMTLLFDPAADFDSWYYRRDPTHVIFFSRATFRWLAEHFGFEEPVFIGDRIILLRNA